MKKYAYCDWDIRNHFLLALAVLFSSDRKNIRWRYVGLLLVIQLIFAFILLKTNLGISVIGVFQMVLIIY